MKEEKFECSFLKSVEIRKKIFWGSVILVGVFFLIWNVLTPLVADDFSYAFADLLGEKRVGSIADIIHSMWNHAFQINGRLIPHSFVEFFIWIGKGWFNVVNTCIYIAYSLLIYKFMNDKIQYNFPLYIGIHAAIILAFPVYGQSMLWLDGACNYLWGTTFILMFIYLYYMFLYDEELFQKKRWMLIAVVLGFFAGGVSENSSAACVFGIFLFLLLYKLKKRKVPVWAWLGWGSSIVSWGLMICAPANFKRRSSFDEGQGWEKWLDRFQTCNEQVKNNVLLLVVICLILMAIEYSVHRLSAKLLVSVIFFGMFLAANYSMIMVPIYPDRAMTGAITFLIICAGILITSIDMEILRNCVLCVVVFMASLGVITATGDILYYSRRCSWREELILEDKAKGIKDVETFAIDARSRWCAAYSSSPELSEDKDYFKNYYMAAYYGLDSIVKKSE